MTEYEIRSRPSTHSVDRMGKEIKYIVIHGTESGIRQGEEGSLAYLVQNAAGVSCNDFVYDRRVWQMVPEERGSNGVAYSVLPSGETGLRANQVTYNIEGYKVKDLPMSQLVRDTIALRVADLATRWGWSPEEMGGRILFHREVDTRGKSCPGLDFNKAEFVHKVQHNMVDGAPHYDKLCWVIENGSDVLRREGFYREVEMLLQSDLYKEWRMLRDNG